MNKEMNLIETDAEAERLALTTALSDEQNDDPMHTAPSGDERANYGRDADVMMTR